MTSSWEKPDGTTAKVASANPCKDFVSMICSLNISKSDINHICGISEVTINKCYKKMDVIKESLIPNCILVKYS